MPELNSHDSPRASAGLLIVNADDWGGWSKATDAALSCYASGRITSVSAMVFMEDSARAASIANECGIDVGLHINFTQGFTAAHCPASLAQDQVIISRFLKRRRSALVLFNPMLRAHFRRVFQFQYNEFLRIYGRPPSHFDGHQHMHLSSNMLVDSIIPRGAKVRRSFSFATGQKSFINRAYRHIIFLWLKRRYNVPRYFLALSQHLDLQRLSQALARSQSNTVELMTHPEITAEHDVLMSDSFARMLKTNPIGPYSAL